MARLGLEALRRGADNIPDKAFENIPYIGPRYFKPDDSNSDKDQDKNRGDDKMSHPSHRDDRRDDRRGSISEDSDDAIYEEARRDRDRSDRRDRRDRRRARRDDRSSNGDHERGYDSDRGPPGAGTGSVAGGYSGNPYFPPPPQIAVDDLEAQQEPYIPRPYKPEEYGAHPGTRDTYYSGHPQERAPYVPPAPPIGDGLNPGSQQQRSRSAQPHFDTSRHSSVADRYRPDEYDPRDSYRRQDSYGSRYDERYDGNPDYPHELTVRHPSRYSPDYDSDEERHRGRDSNKERSGSRRGSIREKSIASMNRVKEEVVKHKKDIGAGAIGAIAGGIIGNMVANAAGKDKRGHGRNSGGPNYAGALIGAAIGGLGAAALENRHESRKREKEKERQEYEGHY